MFNNSVDNMTIFKGSQKWLPLIRILRLLCLIVLGNYNYFLDANPFCGDHSVCPKPIILESKNFQFLLRPQGTLQ